MAIKIEHKRSGGDGNTRFILVGALIIFAFFASYSYAASSRSSASNNPAYAGGGAQASQAGGAGGGAGGAGGAGFACCGGGGPQKTVKGSTTVAGAVQKVTIDLTTGSYSPNEITAKAGVPIEITFKGPASSCNGAIVSQDLGINGDYTNGGVVNVPALKAGTYTWACSMQMYTGKLIVK
jgi:hypothetical protein